MLLREGTATYRIRYARDNGHVIDDQVAQTIASWWHSPNDPELTRLSHTGVVGYAPALLAEIESETTPHTIELHALAAWVRANYVTEEN